MAKVKANLYTLSFDLATMLKYIKHWIPPKETNMKVNSNVVVAKRSRTFQKAYRLKRMKKPRIAHALTRSDIKSQSKILFVSMVNVLAIQCNTNSWTFSTWAGFIRVKHTLLKTFQQVFSRVQEQRLNPSNEISVVIQPNI